MAAMKSSTTMFMMMMFIVASMQMQSSMAQTRHVVGDALGWNIPPNTATYTTWASQQTFNVGDTLFFNFTTNFHNVAEVTQAAYNPCTTANPISITTTGPTTVTLTTAGAHYYICTVGQHCQIGQKLAINVSAPPPPATTPTPPPTTVSPPTATPAPSTTTPPPTSSLAPSPTGATPPSSPTSDTTPPPSPSTAARSFNVVVPATFLAIALALFY